MNEPDDFDIPDYQTEFTKQIDMILHIRNCKLRRDGRFCILCAVSEIVVGIPLDENKEGK